MNIVTIVGARPQFIKAAAVSRVLAAAGILETIIHTGQHYDTNMSEVFFSELGIPAPDRNLGIGGGSHGANTGRMIESIESVLTETSVDLVLVYGDTDSTLAGALAAVKLHIPVAHVEAGLRSFNRRMPEEINRVLTDHAADLLFAPTLGAVEHLTAEGLGDGRVHLVGDVMYDVALSYAEIAETQSNILATLGLVAKEYSLATIHRAENTDDPDLLSSIIDGIALSNQLVVLPLHPRTRARLEEFKLELPQNIHAVDPVGYLDMVKLERNARVIATDSGGVQKEAYFHRIPCVTLREETEWIELIESGWNRLASPHDSSGVAAALTAARQSHGQDIRLYGDGDAAEKITAVLTAL